MSAESVRLLYAGVPKPVDSKKIAIVLILVLLLPVYSPVQAEQTIGRDDFGILQAMADALNAEAESGEDEFTQILLKVFFPL